MVSKNTESINQSLGGDLCLARPSWFDSATRTEAERRERPRAKSWPPTRDVQKVLRAARRRYHASPPLLRPALNIPTSCVGLFTMTDLTCLARWGYWPLPERALDWIATTPKATAQCRHKQTQRIAGIVRALLMEELPAAVAYVARRKS